MTDPELLDRVSEVARRAGAALLQRFSPNARPRSRGELLAAMQANEAAVRDELHASLRALRPSAGWVADELETGVLPAGEWWAVDTVEGNVNHVHGMNDWCVTITLLRDGQPVLTAVEAPAWRTHYTAREGHGAFANGVRMAVSDKRSLAAALVATGQAEAGQTHTYARIGASITAMLQHALLVRASVPSTFPLLLVAHGQNDLFWQYEPTLPGVAAGVLLVREAGGIVTSMDGSSWRPGSADIVASAPGLHAAGLSVLSATQHEGAAGLG